LAAKPKGIVMPNGREIICRYDLVEIFAKRTNDNLQRQTEIFRDVIYELDDLIGKHGKLYRIGNRRVVRFSNDCVSIILFWPLENADSNDIFRVRIKNKCKWMWDTHHGYIRTVGDILDIYKIDYAVSKAEIAFDTLDKGVFRDFLNCTSLKWGRTRKLFNFDRQKKRIGYSLNGTNEYMFSRMSRRRQTHSYEKKYKDKGLDGKQKVEVLYRWELKLWRKYLKSQLIESLDDLFKKIRALVTSKLRFERLERKKLNREIRRAKDWKLDGKSIAGQKLMMRKNGITREQMKRYFVTVPPPEIKFMIGDPDEVSNQAVQEKLEYALWGDYVRRVSSASRITRGRISEDIDANQLFLFADFNMRCRTEHR